MADIFRLRDLGVGEDLVTDFAAILLLRGGTLRIEKLPDGFVLRRHRVHRQICIKMLDGLVGLLSEHLQFIFEAFFRSRIGHTDTLAPQPQAYHPISLEILYEPRR
jgi:hypothetical protein